MTVMFSPGVNLLHLTDILRVSLLPYPYEGVCIIRHPIGGSNITRQRDDDMIAWSVLFCLSISERHSDLSIKYLRHHCP